MESKVKKQIEEMYGKFVGLPNLKPIVRNGIKGDAFTLAILDIVYSKLLNFVVEPNNIDKISKIIVAPPDSGIDLFVEIDDGDEYFYDIIQAKYSQLTENEISKCFAEMGRTIKKFLKDPNLVQPNLKEIISETNFSESYRKNCTYYVFHAGELNYGKGFSKNEKVVTIHEMETLCQSTECIESINDAKVPYDEFKSDAFSNYILYDRDAEGEQALLCNLRGYDLAKLCNKYISTSLGRNILFGQNLRDSLNAKSKTYDDMKNTIDKEPTRFWHYNNGITIIAEELDAQKDDDENVDLIKLKNFSIINGAQTTSALGLYLKNANMYNNDDAVEKLKNVYVLARIMEVTNPNLRDNISIYNNSQNPITSRDMVSNRIEQRKLKENYAQGEKPNIYVEIKRGSKIPPYPKFEKHQRTTNEELAQLAFAAFMSKPFYAKDKKSSLFNRDYSNDDVIINEYYHQIFFYPENSGETPGILFSKSREDIDEALFIKYLYKQAKLKMKKTYETRIERTSEKLRELSERETDATLENRMKMSLRNKEINNTCMFYCITLYYEIKKEFCRSEEKRYFDYEQFYRGEQDCEYKKKIIDYFADNFLSQTISIISELLDGAGNVANWIRRANSQEAFLEKLNNQIALDNKLERMYCDFVEQFKH